MKILKQLFIFAMLLLSLTVVISADSETGYIVRMNSPSERPIFTAVSELDTAKALVESGDAVYYEENFTVTLPDTELSDAAVLFLRQASLGVLDMSAMTALGADGSGIVVAVIDSGVAETISELEGVVVGGMNCIDNSSDYSDNVGHGTYVSSVIAGKTVGNARGAKIYAYKCFNSSTSSDLLVIADAINAAADNDICKIINMSFGTQNSDVLTDSIEYAVSKGKIVVAAAGNYSSTTLYYPASYENVISVGSVGAEGIVSDFSQKNSGIDVTAPGENIYVYSVSGELKQASGTSFSTPEVAALTACMLELDPTLDFDGIYSLLTTTAIDKGDAGRDNSYGYGIVNPSAIAERLKEFAVLFGDVDGDGKITPADEILLARSLAGMTGYTFDYKKRADINFDGEITPSDHIVLARKIAGWSGYETLPRDQ